MSRGGYLFHVGAIVRLKSMLIIFIKYNLGAKMDFFVEEHANCLSCCRMILSLVDLRW